MRGCTVLLFLWVGVYRWTWPLRLVVSVITTDRHEGAYNRKGGIFDFHTQAQDLDVSDLALREGGGLRQGQGRTFPRCFVSV